MNLLAELQEKSTALVNTTPINTIAGSSHMFVEEPRLNYAAAADPLFDLLKDDAVVGPDHRAPQEWMPGAQTVISIFLPFSDAVKRSNHGPGLPSALWLEAKAVCETVLGQIRSVLMDSLRENGWDAINPRESDDFRIIQMRANWSERHVAYIAGLGSFGRHKSLVGRQGSAGRYSSIITDLPVLASIREYPLFLAGCSDCRRCESRCPAQAISDTGKDDTLCSDFIETEIAPAFPGTHGCGKCLTNVPCQDTIPGR